MIDRILKDSALYTAPVLIARGVAFLLLPVYTRILSPGLYGALDLLMIFGSLVNLLLPLEVSQGAARYTAESVDQPGRKSVYASTALRFTAGCYLVFTAIALALAPNAARWLLGDAAFAPEFRLAVVYLALNGLHALFLNQLKWELRPGDYAKNHILVAVGSALASFLLAFVFRLGLPGILYGMILGATAGLGLGAWQLRDRLRGRFERRALGEMLAYSAPLAVSGLGVFVNTYVDRLMLNHFLSLESVGLYGMAMRIAGLSSLATVGLQSALSPLVFSGHQRPETRPELARLFRLFVAGALLLTLGLELFAGEILRLVTTPAYYAAAPLVGWLAAALLLSGMYVFTPGLSLAKKTVLILAINVGGGILNLLLNLLLIPRLGVAGAAFATLIASAAVFGAYLVLSQIHYRVPHAWLPLLVAPALIAAHAVAGRQLGESGWFSFAAKLAILVVAGLVMIAVRLVHVSEIRAACQRLRR